MFAELVLVLDPVRVLSSSRAWYDSSASVRFVVVVNLYSPVQVSACRYY